MTWNSWNTSINAMSVNRFSNHYQRYVMKLCDKFDKTLSGNQIKKPFKYTHFHRLVNKNKISSLNQFLLVTPVDCINYVIRNVLWLTVCRYPFLDQCLFHYVLLKVVTLFVAHFVLYIYQGCPIDCC